MKFRQLYKVGVAVAFAVLAGCGGGDDDGGEGTGADAATVAIDAAQAPIDSGPGLDSDLPGPDAGGSLSLAETIHCGEDACERDEEICCFTGFPNITQACSADDACGNLTATCDGPEDCESGEVCCGNMEGASCVSAGACTGFAAAELCHTNADCPESNNCHDSKFVPWPIC